jgi:hypothetical protein
MPRWTGPETCKQRIKASAVASCLHFPLIVHSIAKMSLQIECFIIWASGLPMFLQTSAVAGFLVLGYVVYYRYLHPLAKYPGPPLASVTNLWKTYHLWNLHLPHTLVRLHEQYGDVVRVGPNDLSFRNPDAVNTIYKAGRQLQKTSFYDGFTTFNPNLFGTQDEEVCHVILYPEWASH